MFGQGGHQGRPYGVCLNLTPDTWHLLYAVEYAAFSCCFTAA